VDNINDLLFRFKEHLAVLNRSSATVKAYAWHVREFLGAVNPDDIRRVTRDVIEDYVAGLYDYSTKEDRPYRLNTIILNVRSIKRFFEFLESANIVFINPTEFIREPRKAKGLPKSLLTSKEAGKVLDQPNLGTLVGIRDRAILEVFYSAGIRLEELCSLSIYDADLCGGLLRVNCGKGQKDRVVPMGRHAVRFLREYISKVRPWFTKKNRTNRHLFVGRFGKPISKQVVGSMVRTYARAAGIKKQVSSHTFRHTFASALVKNGADIVAVQKMLGHADIKTTQVYIRSLGMDVKSAHKKTHPRERDKEGVGTIKPRIERKTPQHEPK
jgi:integrase/recombinase XerD